ncbi:MAG: DUF1579 domain-containing protein [Longimicrobiales bacterium]
MKAEIREEHRWLERLVGEWTSEFEASASPGEPPATLRVTEVVRSLDGAWVVCEGRAEMPGGGTSISIMTLGFDPAKGRFVGTFVSSMMNHLWVYDGALDANRKVLELDAEGPSFSEEGEIIKGRGLTKYKDFIEFLDDDHRVLSSSQLGEDGEWHDFMRAEYRRK